LYPEKRGEREVRTRRLADAFDSGVRKSSSAAFPRQKTEPWHLPRKMYLREEQWLSGIRQLAEAIGIEGDRELSYLSLPGKDLLDVRMVHDFCGQRGTRLRYLGFNAAIKDKRQVGLSRGELSMLNLAPGCCILPHRFERIGRKTTPQYEKVKTSGPFDVVNLDLCGAAESTTMPPLMKFHPALVNLLQVQHDKREDPWLLLLTVQCTKGKVPKSDMDRYWPLLTGNAERSEAYKSFISTLFPDLDALPDATPLTFSHDQSSLSPLFAVCMGKWLIALSCNCSPKWSVSLTSSFCYRVNDADTPNMLSMAFEFSPTNSPLQIPWISAIPVRKLATS
jgi:hypothetical protein